jgi:hypothetical protein
MDSVSFVSMAAPQRPKEVDGMRPASTLEELHDDTRLLYESITANARRDNGKKKTGTPNRLRTTGKNHVRQPSS